MSFMIPFDVVLVLTAMAIAQRILFRMPWYFVHVSSAALIILFPYVFGLFGRLEFGSYLLFYGSIFAAFALLVQKSNWQHLKGMFCPAFVVPLVLIPFILNHLYEAIFYDWDELAHFGLVLRDMVTRNVLNDPHSLFDMKDKPPGMALFSYFFAKPIIIKEGFYYGLHTSFLVLCASLMLAKISWKKSLSILAFLILSFWIVDSFGMGIRTIYVDNQLSLVWAMGLVSYLLISRNNLSPWLALLPLSMLPMVKYGGFQYLALTYLIIIGDLILRRFKQSEMKIHGLQWGLVMMGPILVILSWSYRVKTLGLSGVSFFERFDLSQVFLPGSYQFNETSDTIFSRFVDFIWSGNLANRTQPSFILSKHGFPLEGITYSFIAALMVATVAFYMVQVVRKKDSELVVGFYWVSVLTFGLLSFCFAILTTYLIIMPPDGLRLVSIHRYLNQFNAGLLWLLVFFLLSRVGTDRRAQFSLWGLVLVAVLYLTPNYEDITASDLNNTPDRVHWTQMRLRMKAIADRIKATVPTKDAKIFTVYQNTAGFPLVMFRYDLYPLKYNAGPWTFGEKYGEYDFYTVNLDLGTLRDNLEAYDYTVLLNVDDQFRQKYGELFTKGQNGNYQTLYRTSQSAGNPPYSIVF